MFKLNDIIPATPEVVDHAKGEIVTKGQVIYIHPEGRYYTLEFTYTAGKIRESRLFTEAERVAGIQQGLFKRPPKSKHQGFACPPGYVVSGFADQNRAFVSEYSTRKKIPNENEFDAAML